MVKLGSSLSASATSRRKLKQGGSNPPYTNGIANKVPFVLDARQCARLRHRYPSQFTLPHYLAVLSHLRYLLFTY